METLLPDALDCIQKFLKGLYINISFTFIFQIFLLLKLLYLNSLK